MRWFPRDPSGLGHPVYSENDFKRYQVYTIYELRAQPVNTYFEEKIDAQMTYVMSGDRTLMDERESRLQSRAALRTNSKVKAKAHRQNKRSMTDPKTKAKNAKNKMMKKAMSSLSSSATKD